jgi:hypothetical protein
MSTADVVTLAAPPPPPAPPVVATTDDSEWTTWDYLQALFLVLFIIGAAIGLFVLNKMKQGVLSGGGNDKDFDDPASDDDDDVENSSG